MINDFRKRAMLALRILKGGPNLTPIGSGLDWISEIDPETIRAEYAGWVYACVHRIAVSVSSVPLRLWRAKSKDRRDWEEVEDHEILDLLDAPNDLMDRTDFLQYLSMQENLTGNSFCWLVDAKNERSIPSQLYPLDPFQTKLKPGKFPKLIDSYSFRIDGEEKIFQPHEIMYSRLPDPRNLLRGFGPTQGAADSIDSDNSARKLMRKLFKNGGLPGMLLKSDTMDATSNETLRESFEEMHSGVQRAYRVGVLPPGVDIAKEATSGRDMEFAELRRVARDEILAMYGVPPVVLGLGLGESINRATAETQEYVYAKYTIDPACKRRAAVLNKNLTSRFGPGLVLEFDNPVPKNIEVELRTAESSLGRSPWSSVNEVRAAMGLPAIEGGNAVMGSSLLTPIGEPSSKSVTYIRRFISKMEKQETAKGEAADEITQAVLEHLKTESVARKKSVKEAISWQPQWEAMVKRVGPHENEFKKKMAQYAKGMGDRAVDALKAGSKAVNPGQIIDRDEEISAIIQLTGPVYEAILEEEGKAAADLIGEAFDAADERIRASLDKAIALMADKYTEETMTLLRDRLEDGIANDEDQDALADRIRDVETLSSGMRAERVAKTESFRTANFATREAWKQSGVVADVKWYTAEDEMVCEFCGPMNGKTVAIDEGFFDKNETIEGADGGTLTTDYAAVENPPLHPNCRCYIRPENISV